MEHKDEILDKIKAELDADLAPKLPKRVIVRRNKQPRNTYTDENGLKSRPAIVDYIIGHPGCSQSAISNELSIGAGQISNVVLNLVKQGLVRREGDGRGAMFYFFNQPSLPKDAVTVRKTQHRIDELSGEPTPKKRRMTKARKVAILKNLAKGRAAYQAKRNETKKKPSFFQRVFGG